MAAIFTARKPEVVGNDYLVLGTMDRDAWRQGLSTPLAVHEIGAVLHDFRESVRFQPVGLDRAR